MNVPRDHRSTAVRTSWIGIGSITIGVLAIVISIALESQLGSGVADIVKGVSIVASAIVCLVFVYLAARHLTSQQ